VSLADLAMAAHLSALDYFGEVPWTEHQPVMEWYLRMKSRPSFRPLLSDRVQASRRCRIMRNWIFSDFGWAGITFKMSWPATAGHPGRRTAQSARGRALLDGPIKSGHDNQ
jgi:hypothetical protein